MGWISRSNAKTAAISAGAAALVALTLTGAPALANRAAPAASPAPPVIVSGAKAGPVLLTSFSGNMTLGTLHLSRGGWTVFAKATVSGQTVQLSCTLSAGGSVDLARTNINGAVDYDEQVALNVTHVFAGNGTAVFRCNASGFSEAVTNIVMTAIKAGTLSLVHL